MSYDPHANYSTRSRSNRQGRLSGNTPRDSSDRLNIREGDTINGVPVGMQPIAAPSSQRSAPATDTAISRTSSQAPVRTVASLQSILPQTKWLWRRWLPRGYVTLLAGVPGVGKSAIALKIAES